MTTIGSPACPLGRLEGLARGGGEGEGRCRLSCPPPKGAAPCDRPPRGGPPNTTSSGHWYLHSKNRFTGNSLGPICCVGLRKSRGDVLSAGPGKQGIGDGDGLGSTGTTDTDAGRHHCGETRPPKELRRKSLCRYQCQGTVVQMIVA